MRCTYCGLNRVSKVILYNSISTPIYCCRSYISPDQYLCSFRGSIDIFPAVTFCSNVVLNFTDFATDQNVPVTTSSHYTSEERKISRNLRGIREWGNRNILYRTAKNTVNLQQLLISNCCCFNHHKLCFILSQLAAKRANEYAEIHLVTKFLEAAIRNVSVWVDTKDIKAVDIALSIMHAKNLDHPLGIQLSSTLLQNVVMQIPILPLHQIVPLCAWFAKASINSKVSPIFWATATKRLSFLLSNSVNPLSVHICNNVHSSYNSSQSFVSSPQQLDARTIATLLHTFKIADVSDELILYHLCREIELSSADVFDMHTICVSVDTLCRFMNQKLSELVSNFPITTLHQVEDNKLLNKRNELFVIENNSIHVEHISVGRGNWTKGEIERDIRNDSHSDNSCDSRSNIDGDGIRSEGSGIEIQLKNAVSRLIDMFISLSDHLRAEPAVKKYISSLSKSLILLPDGVLDREKKDFTYFVTEWLCKDVNWQIYDNKQIYGATTSSISLKEVSNDLSCSNSLVRITLDELVGLCWCLHRISGLHIQVYNNLLGNIQHELMIWVEKDSNKSAKGYVKLEKLLKLLEVVVSSGNFDYLNKNHKVTVDRIIKLLEGRLLSFTLEQALSLMNMLHAISPAVWEENTSFRSAFLMTISQLLSECRGIYDILEIVSHVLTTASDLDSEALSGIAGTDRSAELWERQLGLLYRIALDNLNEDDGYELTKFMFLKRRRLKSVLNIDEDLEKLIVHENNESIRQIYNFKNIKEERTYKLETNNEISNANLSIMEILYDYKKDNQKLLNDDKYIFPVDYSPSSFDIFIDKLIMEDDNLNYVALIKVDNLKMLNRNILNSENMNKIAINIDKKYVLLNGQKIILLNENIVKNVKTIPILDILNILKLYVEIVPIKQILREEICIITDSHDCTINELDLKNAVLDFLKFLCEIIIYKICDNSRCISNCDLINCYECIVVSGYNNFYIIENLMDELLSRMRLSNRKVTSGEMNIRETNVGNNAYTIKTEDTFVVPYNKISSISVNQALRILKFCSVVRFNPEDDSVVLEFYGHVLANLRRVKPSLIVRCIYICSRLYLFNFESDKSKSSESNKIRNNLSPLGTSYNSYPPLSSDGFDISSVSSVSISNGYTLLMNRLAYICLSPNSVYQLTVSDVTLLLFSSAISGQLLSTVPDSSNFLFLELCFDILSNSCPLNITDVELYRLQQSLYFLILHPQNRVASQNLFLSRLSTIHIKAIHFILSSTSLRRPSSHHSSEACKFLSQVRSVLEAHQNLDYQFDVEQLPVTLDLQITVTMEEKIVRLVYFLDGPELFFNSFMNNSKFKLIPEEELRIWLVRQLLQQCQMKKKMLDDWLHICGVQSISKNNYETVLIKRINWLQWKRYAGETKEQQIKFLLGNFFSHI